MIANQRLTAQDGYEVLLFPLPYMSISQDEGGSYSHSGILAIDFLGWDRNGRVYNCPYYAPCSCTCLGTTGDNNRIWESNDLVHLADGRLSKVCWVQAHDNNPLPIGTVLNQGDLLGHTGTAGYVTGDHVHLNFAIGSYDGWDSSTSYRQLKNSIHIYSACYVNNTNIINGASHTWNTWSLTWIARDDYLTQSEMENNATIIINYYRNQGLDDRTIAAILGNMQAESTISPIFTERGGGGGYGLVQWTPMSDLTNACSVLGLSPYTSGDVQIQVITEEITGPSSIRQWYTTQAFIENYYNSGATSDMIGISGSDFLNNTMNWSADKLAILFMAGYERPSYNPLINHYVDRKQYALNWFNYMSGVIPPGPSPTQKRNKFNFVLFDKRRKVYG